MHRRGLQVVSARPEDFVRFINMMLNDVIFCLDDAILKLQDIRTAETFMTDESLWNALNLEQKKEKKEELDKNYGQVFFFLSFALPLSLALLPSPAPSSLFALSPALC
jgi:hypothetical protein